MQEWLKDKKNLPIIAIISSVALIGALVLVLFENGTFAPRPVDTPVSISSGPGAPGASRRLLGSAAPPPGVVAPRLGVSSAGPGVPSGPPVGTAPGQTAAGVGGVPAPPAPLNAAKGPDPFKVPGYHPFRVSQAAVDALRVRNSLPPISIQRYPPKDALVPPALKGGPAAQTFSLTPEVSASMRMSGVITSADSVKALLESNGVSTQVQPGDTVDGGKVLSIQPDGLTLRTADNRLVRVPLSGTPTGGNSPYGGGGGFPGGADPNGPPQQ